MKQLIYTIPPNYNNRKVFEFLLLECNVSRRFCKNISKEKRLKLNGNSVPLGAIVHEGDIVRIVIERTESQNIKPEPIELSIVFEDEDLILINKPPFMLVHPTKNYEGGTLANGVLYHFKHQEEDSIVRFVSRLDRDTSGLILVAKNSFSHMRLAKEMEKGTIKKYYLGLIEGHLDPLEGVIEQPIGKVNETDIAYGVVEGGKLSKTKYKTVEQYALGSLLELELLTGRTHQIRVHLQSLGHSLIGDDLYKKRVEVSSLEPCIMTRQALHAYKLAFPHPRTEEILTFSIALPIDMLEQTERLIQYGTKN
jgi:23S rRNA pseudouridine1911/1915/1917 synthase